MKSDNESRKNEEKSIVQKELQSFFTSEFLNRIDDIIMFKHLTKDDMKIVLDKEIADLKENII